MRAKNDSVSLSAVRSPVVGTPHQRLPPPIASRVQALV